MATNCLEYGLTPNNDSVNTRIEKGTGTLTFLASTGVRAYNDLGAVPPVGSSKAPGCGSEGETFRPEGESILICSRLIFVLAQFVFSSICTQNLRTNISRLHIKKAYTFVCHKFLVLTMENRLKLVYIYEI